MPLHRDSTLENIHRHHRWEVNNQAGLDALVPDALDIHKVAYKKDDDTYHVLKSVSPTVWVQTAYTKSENDNLLDKKANLDINNKIPLSEIPDSILGQLKYMGVWDFGSGLPTGAQKGNYWITSVSGNGYEVGDWAVYNGTSFDKVDNTDAVSSVAGRTGNVVLNKNDVGLNNVDNTSDLNKPISTATQTALDTTVKLIGNETIAGIKTFSSNIVGNITGNAATATKLATARSIALAGDVTGSVTFDGSANVTLAATVANDSHTHEFANLTSRPTTLQGYGVIPEELPANIDLDTKTITGLYSQSSNAEATLVLNYPVASAGLLEVFAYAAMIHQRYWVYNSGNIYYRAKYSTGAWTSWTKGANVNDTVTSATKLATARTINGVAFDGSANITVSDDTKLTKTNPSIIGSITEQVYNLTGAEINPANGTIQYKAISANTTFTETLISGQSVLLRLINANKYTITFPTITWVGALNPVPVLTANCAIALWKEQSTLYGAYIGTLV